MLTKKEINGLNFVFKRLNGEHKDYVYIKNFLKDRYKMSDKDAFEIAYLYDENYQSDGDFTKVTDPERKSYSEYMDLPTEVLVLMQMIGDRDPENYVVQSYAGKNATEVIEHDGTEYYIYDSFDKIESEANDGYGDWLCEDPDDHLEGYIYMTDTDKRLIASEEADNYVDNMDDDDLIVEAGLEEDLEKLNNIESEIEDLSSKIEDLESEIGDLETVLNDLKEESEEREDIIDMIGDLKFKKDELEEQKSDLEDIDIESRKNDIIEEAKEKVRESKSDDIESQLDNDFVSYFIDNGYYNNVRDLIRNGPVDFDCDDVISDYIQNSLYGLDDHANFIGFDNYEEIDFNDKTYYILYN